LNYKKDVQMINILLNRTESHRCEASARHWALFRTGNCLLAGLTDRCWTSRLVEGCPRSYYSLRSLVCLVHLI
jgi:hypothetical protein